MILCVEFRSEQHRINRIANHTRSIRYLACEISVNESASAELTRFTISYTKPNDYILFY